MNAVTNGLPGSSVPGASSLPTGGTGSSVANSFAGGGSGTPANGRGALTVQGLGTFKGGDFTITAYGCTRIGTRVLCDFDLVRQTPGQLGLQPFYTIAIVDDGGKVVPRHDAFYMAADGTQMQAAYISPTPVRYVMEYDNVSASATTVTLVNGSDRIQGVPISAGDGSQPGGGIGMRGGASGGQPAASAPAAAPAAVAAAPAGADPRGGLTVTGIGTFKAGDFALTAYGCYRSGTRVLCDFDLVRQTPGQLGNSPFYTVALVDDGGKITTRHDAYYLGNDGTQMPAAYISPAPVRYIMEYDNVATQFTSVNLINGSDQISSVPISNLSANQTTVPARGGAGAPTATAAQQGQPGQPGQPGASGAMDKAQQGANKVSDAKKKLQSIWGQVSSGTKPNQ